MGKKKNQTVPGTIPSFATGFNPNATYGRTKKEPFLNTSAGQHAIDQDHGGYLGFIGRRGGIDMAAGDPFTAWLNNTKFKQIEDDYNAATKVNPELSFAHYTQTLGIPGNQASMNQGGGVNTGNSFTSSSVGPVPAQKQGKKAPKFQQYAQGVVQAPNLNQAMANWRKDFAKLTPEQQGLQRQGYQYGPTGWSVF